MAMNTDAMLNMLNDINLSALNDPGMFQELEVFAKELMNSSNPAHRFAALKINNRLQENPYYQNYLKTELIQKEEIKAATDKRFENAYQAHRENAAIANVQSRRQEERKEREDFEKSISLQNLSLKDQLIKIEYVMKEMYGNMTGEQQVEFLGNVNNEMDKLLSQGKVKEAEKIGATVVTGGNTDAYNKYNENPTNSENKERLDKAVTETYFFTNGEAKREMQETAYKLPQPARGFISEKHAIMDVLEKLHGKKFFDIKERDEFIKSLSPKEKKEFDEAVQREVKRKNEEYLVNQDVYFQSISEEKREYIKNRLTNIHNENSLTKMKSDEMEKTLKSVLAGESLVFNDATTLRDKMSTISNYLVKNFVFILEESGLHQNPKTPEEIKENNDKIHSLMNFQGEHFIRTITVNSEGVYNGNVQEFFNLQIHKLMTGDPRMLRSDPTFKELFDLNKTIDPDNLILKNIMKGLWWTDKDADRVIELLKKEYENKTPEEIEKMIAQDREELSKINYKDLLEEKRLLESYIEYYYNKLEPEKGSYKEITEMAHEKGATAAIEYIRSHPNFVESEARKYFKLSAEKMMEVEKRVEKQEQEIVENNDLFANLKNTPKEDIDKITQEKNLAATVEDHPNQAEVYQPNQENQDKEKQQLEQQAQANIAIVQTSGGF